MEVWATAKINLFLKVLDRRPDGYHNLETVYQSVGLADRLRFEVSTGPITLASNRSDVPAGGENLVVRVVELMRRRFPGRVGGLRISLQKQIPPGSGLGGGSADAAATLRACNKLFGLGLNADDLRRLATEIGMDVPFLIEGGCAIGRGRGEQLEPLLAGERAWAVIAVPDLAISTRWAYETLSPMLPVESPALEAFAKKRSGNSLDSWARGCFNMFERVVFPAYPQLKAIRDRLLELGCACAFLSGSGSAVVGLTEDRKHAVQAAQQIADVSGFAEAVPFLRSAEFHTAGGSDCA